MYLDLCLLEWDIVWSQIIIYNEKLKYIYYFSTNVFNLFNQCSECQVSKWIRNSQENNGILVVTTLPSGNWMESVVSSSKHNGELIDTNAYLVIFSDDGRTGASNQSYLGKVMVVIWPCYIEWKILSMGMREGIFLYLLCISVIVII